MWSAPLNYHITSSWGNRPTLDGLVVSDGGILPATAAYHIPGIVGYYQISTFLYWCDLSRSNIASLRPISRFLEMYCRSANPIDDIENWHFCPAP